MFTHFFRRFEKLLASYQFETTFPVKVQGSMRFLKDSSNAPDFSIPVTKAYENSRSTAIKQTHLKLKTIHKNILNFPYCCEKFLFLINFRKLAGSTNLFYPRIAQLFHRKPSDALFPEVKEFQKKFQEFTQNDFVSPSCLRKKAFEEKKREQNSSKHQ